MPSSGMTCAHVVNDALRRQRKAVFLAAVGDAAQNAFAQRQQCAGVRQAALDAVGEQFETRPDVANHLALRKIDLLDGGRRVADMDHLRPLRAHDEGRLLDRVVADRDDQVGAVDRLVDVVALAERGRSHVKLAAAGNRPLAHLRVEERDLRAADEAADSPPCCAAARQQRRA